MTLFSKLFKKEELRQPAKKNYKTEDNKLAYSVSQLTYSGDTNSKYHKYLESQGYKLDESLSEDTHKVYHNPNSKKSIIGYKGTTNYKDVLTDVEAIGLNDYEHRDFKYAYNVFDKVKEKYGDNISTSGHSLGASISDRVAAKNDKNSIIFNPGSGPLGFKTSDKTQVYRKQDDQVSKFVKGKNVENLPENKKTVTYGNNSNLGLYALNQLDSHTLDGFDEEFF